MIEHEWIIGADGRPRESFPVLESLRVMPPLRLLRDTILVKRTDHETTDSGLVIPLGTSMRKNARGEYAAEGVVRAVGRGIRRKDGTFRPPDVKVGDVVFFPTWITMLAVDFGGEDLREIKGEDVTAVVDGVAVRPLRARALLRRTPRAAHSPGGLLLPDIAVGSPVEAEVLAVGSGEVNRRGYDCALDFAPGDRVLIAEYGGTEIRLNGVDHFVMRECDMLGVIAEAA